MKIEPFPGQLVKENNYKWKITQEQIDWLCKYFPEYENRILMKKSGMKHSLLHRLAREHGLRKSEKAMKRIIKKHAQQVKRICERNGYYESMRGKQVSTQCREANMKYLREIQQGIREHPFHTMKRENPRKYKKMIEKESRDRREVIRKEKLRMAYGLDRKTKLPTVVICRFTRSQTSHRYNARKKGYIIPEDCSEMGDTRYVIWYDDDTKRSRIIERNLIKDGFKVLPYYEEDL